MGKRGPKPKKPPEPWKIPREYVRQLAEIVCEIESREKATATEKKFFEYVDKVVGGRYRSTSSRPRVRVPMVNLYEAVILLVRVLRTGGLEDFVKAGTYPDVEAVRKAALSALNQMLPGFGTSLKSALSTKVQIATGSWKNAACARAGECPSVGLGFAQVRNILPPLSARSVDQRIEVPGWSMPPAGQPLMSATMHGSVTVPAWDKPPVTPPDADDVALLLLNLAADEARLAEHQRKHLIGLLEEYLQEGTISSADTPQGYDETSPPVADSPEKARGT